MEMMRGYGRGARLVAGVHSLWQEVRGLWRGCAACGWGVRDLWPGGCMAAAGPGTQLEARVCPPYYSRAPYASVPAVKSRESQYFRATNC